MAVRLEGAVELRKALRKFEPELSKQTQKEMRDALKPLVNKARGYLPASGSVLRNWSVSNQTANGKFPYYDYSLAKRGITFKTTPSRPNRNGFRSLAAIINKSAGGAIYETAGRKHPMGRPQAPMVKHYTDAGTANARFEGRYIRSGNKDQSMSNNPNAGKQFIDSMGQMVKVTRQVGQRGRISRKMNGRVIYRAWQEDGGKTQDAVIRAIEKSAKLFEFKVKGGI